MLQTTYGPLQTGCNTITKPKVFIVMNNTSRFVRHDGSDTGKTNKLTLAKAILEREKREVLSFLDEQGYYVDEDCIIENKNKRDIMDQLNRKIREIPTLPIASASQHDSLMMWFIGIETDNRDEIMYVEDGGISIDTIYHIFKIEPGIHKFIGQPKLFFFLKLQGIERVVEPLTIEDAPRLPVDADFWTCLVNLSTDDGEKTSAIAMFNAFVQNNNSEFDLDDLMYYIKDNWSNNISTKLPLVSSTLRHDIIFKRCEDMRMRVNTAEDEVSEQQQHTHEESDSLEELKKPKHVFDEMITTDDTPLQQDFHKTGSELHLVSQSNHEQCL